MGLFGCFDVEEAAENVSSSAAFLFFLLGFFFFFFIVAAVAGVGRRRLLRLLAALRVVAEFRGFVLFGAFLGAVFVDFLFQGPVGRDVVFLGARFR